MKRLSFLSSTASMAALLAITACDDHDHGAHDHCGEPAYGGAATDEAWKAILDAYDQAEVGSPQAVTVTTPAAGATLPASGGPPIFAWTSPIAASMQRPVPHPLAAGVAGQSESSSWLDDALDAVGGFFVGRARAHLPPITGDVYYVEVTIPGRECALRALTTDEAWQPSAADWETLKASGGSALELVVTSAYLTENRISEGPYRPAAPLSFKVQ